MKLWLVVVVAVVAAACTSAAPPPTATPTPTSTPTAAAPLPPLTPAAFFLRVTSPEDEAVVTAASLQVTGETTPDAVVTVNGQIVEVDADGRFQATLSLKEGPNVIEVLASDFSGNQAQELRTVIFVPTG